MCSLYPLDYTSINSEIARKALVQCTDMVVESTIDPIVLARKLYSEMIISDDFYKKIKDKASRDTREDRLDAILDEIKDRVKHNPDILIEFVKILRMDLNREDLANKIINKVYNMSYLALSDQSFMFTVIIIAKYPQWWKSSLCQQRLSQYYECYLYII